MFGVLFELYNPGAMLPGITGVICLVLAFYTMHSLPVNYAGLALIIFAIVLFLLEIKIVSHGLLGIGGVVSLLLGSMMLIHSSSSLEFVKLSRTVILTSVGIISLFFLFILGAGLKAQRRKPVTGIESMVGWTGVSIERIAPSGKVSVHGELWNAESTKEAIEEGKKIRVTGVKNLKL